MLKKMPLRSHEDICIFYKKLPTYNPQMTDGHKRKVSKASHHVTAKDTTNYGESGWTDYDSTKSIRNLYGLLQKIVKNQQSILRKNQLL